MKKSSFLQLEDIKNDVREMARNITSEMTAKAEKDLIKAFDTVIDGFYAGHTPTSYKRHGIGGLYSALISHTIKNNTAIIKVGSMDMEDHYRTTTDVVFDLMWNSGIRGLPRQGDNALTHSFLYRSPNGKIINWGKKGSVWTNHYWSGTDAPYHNLYYPSIDVDGFSIANKTPHQVMYDFVEGWGNNLGNKYMDNIIRKMPKSSIIYK